MKKYIYELLQRIEKYILKPPQVKREISKEVVKKLLLPYCPNLILVDSVYCLSEKHDIKNFVDLTLVDTIDYYHNWYDCDNYSFTILSYFMRIGCYAVFYAQTKNHAFNLFIDNMLNIWIIEPQNDKFFNIKNVSEEQYKNIQLVIG